MKLHITLSSGSGSVNRSAKRLSPQHFTVVQFVSWATFGGDRLGARRLIPRASLEKILEGK